MEIIRKIIAILISATEIMTGVARASYAHLMEPYAFGAGEAKYSVSVLIDKKDTQTLEIIEKAIDNAVKEGIKKYGPGFKNDKMHMPLHDGATEKDDEAYKDCYYLNASSRIKPQIYGPDKKIIKDPSEIYSGMYARFVLKFYPYSVSGTGIAVELRGVQKIEDGEPLGGSTGSLDRVFTVISDESFEDFLS